MLILTSLLILLPGLSLCEEYLEGFDDLTVFVTHPEIKATRLNVTVHHERLVSPGYWFIAPYSVLRPGPQTTSWVPCQIGPHIYDSEGELIWSGACIHSNRNAFDFKPVSISGQHYLSYIVEPGHFPSYDPGFAQILDADYQISRKVEPNNGLKEFNIHEFSILDDGESALVVTQERAEVPSTEDDGLPDEISWVELNGFREVSLTRDKTIFDWAAIDYVPVNESSLLPLPESPTTEAQPWDYVHINSVDKDAAGDYLVSGRHTDCIYKVSGVDGHIIWRLGGKSSDFNLEGFNFSRQHDARFLESNNTHTLISFLDNGGDFEVQTSSSSSGLIVLLHTAVSPMQATLVSRYPRPDGELTKYRGNMRVLPSKNVFINWSDQGYLSEYAPDGTCALEARFISNRFSTYRAYKADFIGLPAEPPRLKVSAFGSSPAVATMVCYVSWNGATEVASWRFYARDDEHGDFEVSLGSTMKRGFETIFMADGYRKWIRVEGLSADGSSLGWSDVHLVERPPGWGSLDGQLIQTPIPDGSRQGQYNRLMMGTIYFIVVVFVVWLVRRRPPLLWFLRRS